MKAPTMMLKWTERTHRDHERNVPSAVTHNWEGDPTYYKLENHKRFFEKVAAL